MTAAPRLLIAFVTLLTLAAGGCGGEPSAQRTTAPGSPSAPASPSASPSASTSGRPELPDPGTGARLGWKPVLDRLSDGRGYYLATPTCTGSRGCAAWLAAPRKLVIWLHGAGESEEPDHVESVLSSLTTALGDGVVPAYGLTAGGTLRWDADICCTATRVDDVGYLNAVVQEVASRVTLDRHGVGLAGASNGGMLATKAICEEPERFAVAAIWAASWRGPCDRGPVRIGHWHGDADPIIALHGGQFPVDGRVVTFPPADWLRGRLAPGSEFRLTVLPGVGHVEMPPAQAEAMLAWLGARL